MLVVGLTGGIGAGKSTVAALFAAKHVPVIDADVIARELVQPHHPIFQIIVSHFGEAVLLQNGQLNRKALKEIVFKTDTERRWLEKTLHPLILNAIQERLKQLATPYCIVVIPLLFETGPHPFLNRILVVTAKTEAQIARIEARDQLSKQTIKKILSTQATQAVRSQGATEIIENTHDLPHLQAAVDHLHQHYLALSTRK